MKFLTDTYYLADQELKSWDSHASISVCLVWISVFLLLLRF
jgi:hypothetical protein